ncbi:MAG: hypothetical protein LBE13_20365 [Bacteroidales bacterium]|jgi:hypothetical protein|nr:hypothetical protein [Bacteroidales bacterium]
MKKIIILTVVYVLLVSYGETGKNQRLQIENEAEEEIYNHYIDSFLNTGATPYSDIYGGNPSCSEYGCSEIKVITSPDFDVLVTIKKENKVVRHAYIRANDSYIFEIPNGVYQPFFYYGRGWYPEKIMKETPEGIIKGGFVSDETFGKDDPQVLEDEILEYQLIFQTNGNFGALPSNAEDAL